MKPGVFDLPSNLGPVAEDISDSTLTLAAFYLKRHIIVFHGEHNLIHFVDGNFFKRGNVEDYAPFILGKTRSHYQTLVPDDSDEHAYQKIRDYVSKKSFEYAREEAIELSIKQKSASDDEESHQGSGNNNNMKYKNTAIFNLLHFQFLQKRRYLLPRQLQCLLMKLLQVKVSLTFLIFVLWKC